MEHPETHMVTAKNVPAGGPDKCIYCKQLIRQHTQQFKMKHVQKLSPDVQIAHMDALKIHSTVEAS